MPENQLLQDENLELTNEQKKELKKEAKEKLKEKEEDIDEVTPEQKINRWFNKIDFLELTPEEKETAAKEIVENIKIDKLYIFEMALSTLIISLGLLQNSAAVVIGGMIIAPLLRPISGLAFSIARGGGNTFGHSFSILFYSIVGSIALAFFTTKLLGIGETTEIISRTNPNLIDFFIAIFSGIFGVLAIKFKRIFQGTSGVAIVVALLPPLCVVGVELAYSNYQAAFGAFLLFSSNILGIVLVSTIFFWLYGFNPHDKKLQTNVLKRLMIFSFSLIIILIPLIFSYNGLKMGNQVTSESQVFLEEELKDKIENFEIEKLKIIENSKDRLYIQVDLKTNNIENLEDIFKKVKEKAKEKFGKKVDIDFDIIKFYRI